MKITNDSLPLIADTDIYFKVSFRLDIIGEPIKIGRTLIKTYCDQLNFATQNNLLVYMPCFQTDRIMIA